MPNNVMRMPQQQLAPVQQIPPGTQQGNWFWDGSNWNCGCDGGGSGQPPFCPPPGWPPPGCPPWFSGLNSPPWYPGANAGISFGTTAPVNPVRGHMWWDGTTFWLFDGAAWVAISTSSEKIKGVTDGSFAAPGYVGEVYQTSSSFNIPATWNNQQNINIGSLPAGDWTLQAQINSTQPLVGGINFYLNPIPTGFYNNMSGTLGVYVTTAEAGMTQAQVVGCLCAASVAAPTNMTMFVQTNYLGGNGVIAPIAGTATIILLARRAR
jgi:hypothetical protein